MKSFVKFSLWPNASQKSNEIVWKVLKKFSMWPNKPTHYKTDEIEWNFDESFNVDGLVIPPTVSVLRTK